MTATLAPIRPRMPEATLIPRTKDLERLSREFAEITTSQLRATGSPYWIAVADWREQSCLTCPA